jgi:20S proteasome subunit beta 1
MSDAEPHTGTTIVACTFNGGVVLGADGRVSTGNYVSNRASNKIMQLTDNVFLLRSGSAADTQAVGDYGKQQQQQQSTFVRCLTAVVWEDASCNHTACCMDVSSPS